MSTALSVVIPCFNESQTLIECISRVRNQSSKFDLEIIVVDDFSTDGSREILASLLQEKQIHSLILHESNKGKGAALRSGFKVATGTIVIIQDADLECDPSEYQSLVDPITNGVAEVVYGSRFLQSNPRKVGSFRKYVANKFLTALSNFFTDLHLTDMETCYKVFRRDVLNGAHLTENRFGFEPEVTHEISRMTVSIAEIPISYNPRTVQDGKKIGFGDGIRAIYVIIKCGLFRKARKPSSSQGTEQ
jgi:glycosyltransferase involved in cell wall biosynthesis